LLKENAYAPELYTQFIAYLKLALGSEQKCGDVRREVREANKVAMCQFIEIHLDRPELSVALLLKNFGVSRASLFRIFEEFGGVRQYISDRRLMRAVLDISKGERRRGEISVIAEKWGFSSHANFNRAVQRKFGLPPGALVGTHLPVNTGDKFHDYGLKNRNRDIADTTDDYVRGVIRSVAQISAPNQLLRV